MGVWNGHVCFNTQNLRLVMERDMSLNDYKESQKISACDYPFYALIMAAMRQADSFNLARLQREFPNQWEELQERYNAPGGMLDNDYIPQPMDYAIEEVELPGQDIERD